MTTLVGVRRALQGSVGSIAQGGAPGVPNPTFWVPFSDAGAGAVNLNAYRGAPGTVATFTRATSATTWSSAGLLLTAATGVARSVYTELTGATYLGYLTEEARTNEVLWCRDLTNAAWVKVTTTAALDQTGIDGTANAASSLTATAGNATTLQIITEASAARSMSVYMKRIIGSGEIDITENGGTAWTNVAGSINSSTYTRVAILNSSVLNPSVGFRIVTNGDKIAVDYVQNELGAFVTTPIATTTVAVTRNVDVLSYPIAGNIDNTLGSAALDVTTFAATSVVGDYLSSIAGNRSILGNNGTSVTRFDGTTSGATGLTVADNVSNRIGVSWSGVTANYARNGALSASNPLTFDGNWEFTTIGIGSPGSGGSANAAIKNVRIWTRALTTTQIVTATA